MTFLRSFFKLDPVKLLAKGDIDGIIRARRHKYPETRSLAAAALGEAKGDRARDVACYPRLPR